MEITGKIILELPERSGISARSGSEWRLKSFVLETMDQYSRKMQFEVFGADRIAQMNIVVGEIYTISFDIDAREYQGRWYNSIRAFRAVPANAAAPVMTDTQALSQSPFEQTAAVASPVQQPIAPVGDTADDLPF